MEAGELPLWALSTLSARAAYKFCVSGGLVRMMVDGYPRSSGRRTE